MKQEYSEKQLRRDSRTSQAKEALFLAKKDSTSGLRSSLFMGQKDLSFAGSMLVHILFNLFKILR